MPRLPERRLLVESRRFGRTRTSAPNSAPTATGSTGPTPRHGLSGEQAGARYRTHLVVRRLLAVYRRTDAGSTAEARGSHSWLRRSSPTARVAMPSRPHPGGTDCYV